MRFFMVLSLLILMTACGKNVSTENPVIPTPPNSNPGIVVGEPLPSPVGSSGVMRLNFANHAYDNYSTAQNSIYTFSNDLHISFPTNIIQTIEFSFDSEELNNPIEITVNGQTVCSYSINHSYNLQKTDCEDSVLVRVGDEISIEGIPSGETLKLNLEYSK